MFLLISAKQTLYVIQQQDLLNIKKHLIVHSCQRICCFKKEVLINILNTLHKYSHYCEDSSRYRQQRITCPSEMKILQTKYAINIENIMNSIL